MADETPSTLDPEPEEEATPRERLAALLDRRLDIPMAILAVAWALLVGYELVAPPDHRAAVRLAGNVIWILFAVEFITKLAVSGRPLRFLRRRWPTAIFLFVPALRMLRVVRAARVLHVLPAARVTGASYRALGTARSLLHGRLTLLLAATGIVVFSGGQLLYVLERGQSGGVEDLGAALWWSAHAAIAGELVFDPVTGPGQVLAIGLVAYAVVIVAAIAGSVGAFFVESRAEHASRDDEQG